MNISITATNPCHLWPLARGLAGIGTPTTYYSGYPKWRLPGANELSVRSHPLRTIAVYGLLRYIPEKWRPSNRSLFLWQDAAFDKWVARTLAPGDFVHSLPGQALRTFTRAKALGIRTVLNHATGPVANLQNLVLPEFQRLGLEFADHSAFDDAYLERENQEYQLADFHCVASTIVRDQLIQHGVPAERIWLVPYGADASIWHPPTTAFPRTPTRPFRILFAGQLSLRKGLRFLLEALTAAGDRPWRLDCYGPVLDESRADRQAYRGSIPVHYHGPVQADKLAGAMRRSDVLVLPSLEEGFGLVVPQALACGLPCIVSDAVGAKDLIDGHPARGGIFPSGDPIALQKLLTTFATSRTEPETEQPKHLGTFDWSDSARQLVAESQRAMASQSSINL